MGPTREFRGNSGAFRSSTHFALVTMEKRRLPDQENCEIKSLFTPFAQAAFSGRQVRATQLRQLSMIPRFRAIVVPRDFAGRLELPTTTTPGLVHHHDARPAAPPLPPLGVVSVAAKGVFGASFAHVQLREVT